MGCGGTLCLQMLQDADDSAHAPGQVDSLYAGLACTWPILGETQGLFLCSLLVSLSVPLRGSQEEFVPILWVAAVHLRMGIREDNSQEPENWLSHPPWRFFFWSQVCQGNRGFIFIFLRKAGCFFRLLRSDVCKGPKKYVGLFASTQNRPTLLKLLKNLSSSVICHFLLLSKMITILLSLLICSWLGKLITKLFLN